jgi:hypothetical protein
MIAPELVAARAVSEAVLADFAKKEPPSWRPCSDGSPPVAVMMVPVMPTMMVAVMPAMMMSVTPPAVVPVPVTPTVVVPMAATPAEMMSMASASHMPVPVAAAVAAPGQNDRALAVSYAKRIGRRTRHRVH